MLRSAPAEVFCFRFYRGNTTRKRPFVMQYGNANLKTILLFEKID